MFHEKLGTQAERIARIERLAAELAPLVGADVEKAKRAARLRKADLLTDMVGEFPELQGLMGKYYARAQGEDASVAAACEEHYKPHGPGDRVPTDPVSIAVALADKLDTLVGFWAIDEKPTGSKDPYALRRAALGVIRIILDNQASIAARRMLRLLMPSSERIRPLRSFHEHASIAAGRWSSGNELKTSGAAHQISQTDDALVISVSEFRTAMSRSARLLRRSPESPAPRAGRAPRPRRRCLRARGQDDLLLIVRRVEALGQFLDTEDGKNLLAGYKRAANILRIEEKRDGTEYDRRAVRAFRQAEE